MYSHRARGGCSRWELLCFFWNQWDLSRWNERCLVVVPTLLDAAREVFVGASYELRFDPASIEVNVGEVAHESISLTSWRVSPQDATGVERRTLWAGR